jgi:hypothetical protein
MATQKEDGQQGLRKKLWERAKKVARSVAKVAVPVGATVQVITDVCDFLSQHL